ncbi:MAG: threonine/serine exporter family protein [Oscillospiraceae bacterium]|nr:threonine/serine exporter family protein [Oscillospiraceae bacterium]MBR3447644.1 threonine/serine exporter family protein [Oscillospiraceae bacterium]
MELKSLNCPNCGASVQIPEGKNLFFCTYCGSQIQIDDGKITIDLNANINLNHQYSDVARLKELELQEQERKRQELAAKKEKLKPLWWLGGVLVWLIICAAIILFNSGALSVLFIVLWLGGTAVFAITFPKKSNSPSNIFGCIIAFLVLFGSLTLIKAFTVLIASLLGISLAT